MNRIELLEQLKRVTEYAVNDLILPVRTQKDGGIAVARAADVYLMRLPDGKSATKKCPYIIHQFVFGADQQEPGQERYATAMVRSIFSVYHENEQEGALALLNLMERVRIALLKNPTIGGQFSLDEREGVQIGVDYEDISPYYRGEMVTNWTIPPIEREDIRKWL